MWAAWARRGSRLELAARCADDFPDGVFVIELAAVGDPAAIPDAVAAVLGITQQPGLSLADSIAAALDGRSRLLVFDNCEHILDAAADLIEKILTRSATVRMLATSREGLRVADEHLWSVPSLDIDSTAATLFVERARAVAPEISRTNADHARAIVEICRRLDGIPLGIELAASRLQSMTVTEVRDRLNDRFRLLVGSRRGLERHQTLRHAVQWSYDLLDDAEKALLAQVFGLRRGFDLAGRPRGRRLRRRVRRRGSARCAGAQVTVGRRPIRRANTVFDAGDHPPIRRGTTPADRRG